MPDLLTCGLFIAGTRGHTPIQCACFLQASSTGFPRRVKKGVSPWGGEVAGASVRVAAGSHPHVRPSEPDPIRVPSASSPFHIVSIAAVSVELPFKLKSALLA